MMNKKGGDIMFICPFSKAYKLWPGELDRMQSMEFYTGYRHPDMDQLERKEKLLLAIQRAQKARERK